jgi:hypothetical protein
MGGGRRLSAAAGAAILALDTLSGGGGASAEERYVTATGQEVVLQPVSGMDCDALLAKIMEIDETGYRGRRPAPPRSRDRRLLAYEQAVSTRYYTRCSGGGDDTVSEVLRRGFSETAD